MVGAGGGLKGSARPSAPYPLPPGKALRGHLGHLRHLGASRVPGFNTSKAVEVDLEFDVVKGAEGIRPLPANTMSEHPSRRHALSFEVFSLSQLPIWALEAWRQPSDV